MPTCNACTRRGILFQEEDRHRLAIAGYPLRLHRRGTPRSYHPEPRPAHLLRHSISGNRIGEMGAGMALYVGDKTPPFVGKGGDITCRTVRGK